MMLTGDTQSDLLRRPLKEFTKGLGSFGEVDRVEREKLLVAGDHVQTGGGGRVGGVHSVLLRSARDSGEYDSGKSGSRQFLP